MTELDATAGQQEGNEDAPSVTVAAVPPAPSPKRPPGRPVGARNKVNRDLSQFIRDKGKPIEFLVAVARGNRMRVADPDKLGRAVYTYPDLKTRVQAALVLADKVLPSLKATELTGKDGQALIPGGITPDHPNYEHELAKSIVAALASGVPEARVTVTEPGQFTATFADGDLGRRLHLDTADATIAVSDSPKPTPRLPYEIGRWVIAAGTGSFDGRFVICRSGDPAVIEVRDTYGQAEQRVHQLIEAKKF